MEFHKVPWISMETMESMESVESKTTLESLGSLVSVEFNDVMDINEYPWISRAIDVLIYASSMNY